MATRGSSVRVKFADGTVKEYDDAEFVRKDDALILLTRFNVETKKVDIVHQFRLDNVQMALAFKYGRPYGEPVEGLAQPFNPE